MQINPNLNIDDILLTRVDNRTNLAKDISGLVRSIYGGRGFKTEIPHTIRAAEMSGEAKSIFQHDPQGKAAGAYENLIKEMFALEKQRQNIELTKCNVLFKKEDVRQEEKREHILIVPAEQVSRMRGCHAA